MADFPPSGTTLAVGSLPHKDPKEAVDFVFRPACDVPFWPQLPKRSFRELMIPQFAEGLPGLVIDEEKKRAFVDAGSGYVEALTAFYEKALDEDSSWPLSRTSAAGFFEFTGRLENADSKPGFVKGQVTGPVTFMLGLNMPGGRPIYSDEQLRDAAVRLLAGNASWQVSELKKCSSGAVIVSIDEPIFSALGTAAYLSVKPRDVAGMVNEVAGAIRRAGGIPAVHCCGGADWEAVCSFDIDVLNFDAWSYFETLAVYSDALHGFLDRGGRIAFGIVPTDHNLEEADEKTVCDKLDHELNVLESKGLPGQLLRERALLTPSCGCGSRTMEETERVFDLLAAAKDHFAQG